jgi:hypothetical protein
MHRGTRPGNTRDLNSETRNHWLRHRIRCRYSEHASQTIQ